MQEFERLEDASGVFKLIGPVLIRQDPIEVRRSNLLRLSELAAVMLGFKPLYICTPPSWVDC
jgi:hypothetical protein